LCLDPKDFPRLPDSDQEVDVDAYLEDAVSLQEANLASLREPISFFTGTEIATTRTTQDAGFTPQTTGILPLP
jgi:hypothetical protein